MKFVTGKGKARVELDDGGLFDRWSKSIAPNTRAAMDTEIERILADAREAWPVRTGKSKAALESAIRVIDQWQFTATITNDVPYAKLIRSLKIETGTGSAYVELLRKPINAAAPAVADALAAEIAQGMNRG